MAFELPKICTPDHRFRNESLAVPLDSGIASGRLVEDPQRFEIYSFPSKIAVRSKDHRNSFHSWLCPLVFARRINTKLPVPDKG